LSALAANYWPLPNGAITESRLRRRAQKNRLRGGLIVSKTVGFCPKFW